MAHSDYCYVLHNNKGPGSPHASRSCLSRNRLNSDGCETRRTTFLRAHHHAHAEHVHHSHHHVVDKSYRAHRGSPFLKACGNYSAAFFLCQPFFQKAFLPPKSRSREKTRHEGQICRRTRAETEKNPLLLARSDAFGQGGDRKKSPRKPGGEEI